MAAAAGIGVAAGAAVSVQPVPPISPPIQTADGAADFAAGTPPS